MAYKLIFVILLHSPSCFGQETAKKPFGLQVKLPRLVYHTLWSLHGVLFLLLNAKQGIEPISSISVTDARSLIGANFFFIIQQNLRYLIATTTVLIGHTLCFFVRKVEKNSRLNYQKGNNTSRDLTQNLTETTKNCNKSVISVIQFSM